MKLLSSEIALRKDDVYFVEIANRLDGVPL